jgi:hypothetical protein
MHSLHIAVHEAVKKITNVELKHNGQDETGGKQTG